MNLDLINIIQEFLKDSENLRREQLHAMHNALVILLKKYGPLRLTPAQVLAENEPIIFCGDLEAGLLEIRLDPCEHMSPTKEEKTKYGN